MATLEKLDNNLELATVKLIKINSDQSSVSSEEDKLY